MCLSVPAKVVEVRNNVGRVEVGGTVREISMDLCPEARIGDYVLIHAGFATQQLDQEEAEETIQLLKQLVEIR
jgi:hydrogenase expression/formation protein HypC